MRVLLIVAAFGGTAAASPAWVGTFQPLGTLKPCDDCGDKLAPIQQGGTIVVLTPRDAAPPTGELVVIEPLVGFALHAKVDKGRAAVPVFLGDRRDGDNGVLVLPAGTDARLVPPSPADIAAIKAAIMKNEALSGVHKAVAKLEIGAIDIDGDHKADFAVTYGCTAWGDGACQLHGQFILERRAGKWVELE